MLQDCTKVLVCGGTISYAVLMLLQSSIPVLSQCCRAILLFHARSTEEKKEKAGMLLVPCVFLRAAGAGLELLHQAFG